jgi:hypothetical protein
VSHRRTGAAVSLGVMEFEGVGRLIWFVEKPRDRFRPTELRTRIAALDGYPVLTRASESSVPGLYFTGALAAYGLGPSMRFIAGTHNAAGPLARSVAQRSKISGGRPAAPEMADVEA